MKKTSKDSLPTKKKMRDIYTHYNPYLLAVLDNIQKKLDDTICLTSGPTYKRRVKSFDSYYKKCIRLKPDEAASSNELICLTDIIGIRVVCAFLEDLSSVLEDVKRDFVIREIENKSATHSFKEFGYDSIHVLVEIPDDCFPQKDDFDLAKPKNLVCEIQIRTILQDAWAEVEHELIYKGEFSPFDMPLRRKLASINASLNLADIIFQEIRDYQKKLQSEVDERRFLFYEKVDEKIGSVTEVQKKTLPLEKVSPFVQGTIDDLILAAMHAHNSGHLDEAISIYTQIIDSHPNAIAESVVRKHRGMAYFTENNYESALLDFQKSSELDPKNFRSLYYEGIVHAILHKWENAVDCYTRSISLNEYHSHAFFRRAMAYYELDEYENALNDVISAKKLGIDDSGCNALHHRLLKKLDMEV